MKYDINLFEQLNEEYRAKPVKTTFPQTDSDYQYKIARSRLTNLNKLVPLMGKKVLEIGCGRGYVSSLLASEYDCSIVGVDIIRRNEWDLLKSKSPELDYRVVDLSSENLFEAESFDLVTSFVVWEHIIHPFTILKECCKLLKPTGAMYLYANLYRSPNGSHRYRQVFFPFPHLLFNDEVFSEFFTKYTGRSNRPSRLNKLTYSHYKEYFRILNLKIEYERLHKVPLDKGFYNRFADKLECYPIFDLELEYFTVLLRKSNPSINQEDVSPAKPSNEPLNIKRDLLKAGFTSDQSDLQKALLEQNRLTRQIQAFKYSFSYQLGNILVQAVRKPGRNTILLPYNLLLLYIKKLKKTKNKG